MSDRLKSSIFDLARESFTLFGMTRRQSLALLAIFGVCGALGVGGVWMVTPAPEDEGAHPPAQESRDWAEDGGGSVEASVPVPATVPTARTAGPMARSTPLGHSSEGDREELSEMRRDKALAPASAPFGPVKEMMESQRKNLDQFVETRLGLEPAQLPEVKALIDQRRVAVSEFSEGRRSLQALQGDLQHLTKQMDALIGPSRAKKLDEFSQRQADEQVRAIQKFMFSNKKTAPERLEP